MPDLSFIFAANAIALLVISGAVFLIGKRKLQGSVWLVYNLLFCVWNFCLYQALIQETRHLALFWIRASLIPIIFIAPVLLHFLSIYSDKEILKGKLIGIIYILSFSIFAFSFAMPGEFVRGLNPGTHFKYLVAPGAAFGIFAFIFIGFIFCGFFYLVRRTRKMYLAFRRNQRIWIFAGMFLSILAPVGFFSAAYGINFFSFGLFCTIPYLLLTGYAVLRYHVPEVAVLFKKTSLLSYSTVFIIAVYIVTLYLFNRIIGIGFLESSVIAGCVVLLNILLTAHYGGILRLNNFTDNIVYKKRLAYYEFLENFNHLINEKRDLNTLLYYIADSLANIIGIKCIMLYLLDEESFSFRLVVCRGADRRATKDIDMISAESPLVKFLKEGNIFDAAESADFADAKNLAGAKKAFEKFNVRLTLPLLYSMPLYHGGDIAAFLNLGEKKDRKAYTAEDIDIVNAFGREFSTCIDKARLSQQVISDDLTGLYKRSYFYKRLEEELERSKRYDRVFSLFFIDVDKFKTINDVFGHQAGDNVLKKVARLIKSCLRKVDIAARHGGEEFAVLLPETGRESAPVAAERLRKIIEEEFKKDETKKEVLMEHFAGGVRFNVTISIGMSVYRPGVTLDALIKEADKALYRAKWEGRNRVCSESKGQ